MDDTTCADVTASPASLLPTEPPGSAVAGAVTSAHVDCPHCDLGLVDTGDDRAPCTACLGAGVVCSYCGSATLDVATATHQLGECLSCGTTVRHRTTWATRELYEAAYDPDSWEGLYRRCLDMLDARTASLTEARDRVTSLTAEVLRERSKVLAAQHEVRQYAANAQCKIDEMHREHRREVEDLQRQLRLASRRLVDLKTERAA